MNTFWIISNIISFLAPYILTLVISIITGVSIWKWQAKKKMEFDLRKETFLDALELINLCEKFHGIPTTQKLSPEKQPQVDEFIRLKEKVKKYLLICGSTDEIAEYKKFLDAVVDLENNNTTSTLIEASNALNTLKKLFTMSIRREIGKDELNVTL